MSKKAKRKTASRVVLVHPRWRTVHELYANGTAANGPACGNPLDKIDYQSMSARNVEPGWPPCQSAACDKRRRAS